MGKLFGTDGVRGKANQAPMDSETVLRLGRAAAHVFRRSAGRHRILIGKDTRVSGYMLETALCSGFSSMGVDVLLVGPLPTPGVAFMARSMRADAGVMISASHNSYEDNGIKFFGADGLKLADEVEEEIERLVESDELDQLRAHPDEVGKAFRVDDALGRYTVYLKSCVDRQMKFDGLRLALDTANGAAYRVAPMMFSELGATIYTTGDHPDGKNINDACGSTHPESVASLVRKNAADCGIAYDGDADRVVFVDEQGEVVDGDLLLAICATEFKKQGRLKGDAVVLTVMSNLGLELSLKEQGIDVVRSDVGDRYVLAEMLERGLNLGGEQSGHIICLDYNTTGDGLLTSLLVLSILLKNGKPLSHYRTLFERYPQILINVPVKRKPPLEDLPKMQSELKLSQEKLGKKGRVLVRYSGTESKARVMVEADDYSLCEEIAGGLSDILREELS